MNKNLNFIGLGHCNIVVNNITEAIKYYKELLNAKPYQIFKNFKNVGFAKAAGFLTNPEQVELHIAFLEVPGTGLTLELMEYINPSTTDNIQVNPVNVIAGVRHIAIKVEEIESVFNHIKAFDNVKLINESIHYRPYKIDNISPDEFTFFDNENEMNSGLKDNVCKTIGQTFYFYCIDQYGVQWEFEQGHSDVGTDTK